MITDADAALHRPDSDDPMWAETNWWGFHVPELNMNGHVYCLFRPNQGVCLTTVGLNSRRCQGHWEAEYYDMSVHVPMGERFDLTNYRLASGVSVRSRKPVMDYRVDYDDGQGVEIHFEYRALAPGYDIHDPDLDPMVAAGHEASEYSWGTAYNGHYDQNGAYEGEIVIDGRTIEFRCLGQHDHSWGPRPERHPTTMSWLNVAFGEDLVLHALCDFDPAAGASELRFTHGYVVENGKLTGLAGGRGKTRRDGFFAEEIDLVLNDASGREWTLHGEAVTRFPWPTWPGVIGFNSLTEWQCGERRALGEAYDYFGLQTLNALGRSPQ